MKYPIPIAEMYIMINQPYKFFILGGLLHHCSLTFHHLKRNNNSTESFKHFFFNYLLKTLCNY